MRHGPSLAWFVYLSISAWGQEPSAIERHRRDPGRQVQAHATPAAALSDRIADIPPTILSYLIKDGALNGFPATPRPHPLDDWERATIRTTLAALPEKVRALAEQSIVAIYFVDELGSSAWTEYFDPPVRQSFMVFDAAVLRETPNAWATRKERSAFADTTALRLEIAEAHDNVPGGAFRFIFLHELGHAIGYARHLLPAWVEEPAGDYPFVKLAGGRRFEPVVPFYAAPEQRLPAASATDIYARWSKSAYPTLYATTSADDDFAETFASYVHLHVLQQPYRLFVAGERYQNGLLHPRCAQKRAFVAALLQP